ncbi:MAG: plasmid stability protein [Deltaproteobacteria bacterium]|nr:plasmid stability protein [Deltaproteobacteria bacterium]
MPSLTLKNVPPDVHRRLKARARRHRMSLNREAIECLREATGVRQVDPEMMLAEIRELRARVNGKLSERQLAKLKGRGRP